MKTVIEENTVSQETVRRVAMAIKDEMRKQDVLYEADENGSAQTTLMMNTGAVANLTAIALSAIAAIASPGDPRIR